MIKTDPSAIIEVSNISKRFGRVQALQDVSFRIKEGEIVGFLGPNGAGKTTAMRILSGYFPSTDGKVRINSEELFKNPKMTKKNIGYLPEIINLYKDMRAIEFLKFVANLKGLPSRKVKEHVEEKMAECGLLEVKNRLIGHLSKGFKQRVGIAQALIGDPKVLILDEPTNGLDPKQITEIRELIRRLGKERSIILSTHILPEVSTICDRVLMIDNGRIIAEGTVEELGVCLKDRQEIFVTIGDPGRSDEAFEILKSFQDAHSIKQIEKTSRQVQFSFEFTTSDDKRPEISRIFVSKGIPLLEIRLAKLSLEDIFLRLLENKNNNSEKNK